MPLTADERPEIDYSDPVAVGELLKRLGRERLDMRHVTEGVDRETLQRRKQNRTASIYRRLVSLLRSLR